MEKMMGLKSSEELEVGCGSVYSYSGGIFTKIQSGIFTKLGACIARVGLGQ